MDLPIFSRVYQQKDHKLIVSGKTITGFMDGTPFTVRFKGGEVDLTEGTDGPGLNRATMQGGEIEFTIRETSGDYSFLYGLFIAQSASALTTVVTLNSGARMLYTLLDAAIALPGELTTGDKKQAGITFRCVGRLLVPVDVGYLESVLP